MENQETTELDSQAEALETPNQEQVEKQAPQEDLDASAAEAQLDVIPEKFVGKSPLDIIKAYNNAERQLSKVSSERSEERKKREELERRVSESESRLQALSQQPAQRQLEASPEVDPFAEYEKKFDEDPKGAIRSLVSTSREQIRRERELGAMQQEAAHASEYYQTQKRDNPEYAKLEPTMQALAREYGDLVDPRKVNSVKALKLLHLAAQGLSREAYASEIASKAKKETTALKQEKRSAFSESSSSKGNSGKAFEDLSIEEMEKLLGVTRS